jgi:hypothetical protein
MTINGKIWYTAKELVDNVNKDDKDDKFNLRLNYFLDCFYGAETEIRQKMIDERPNNLKNSLPSHYMPVLASSVHKLANDYSLIIPPWVFEDRCYLTKSPYFMLNATGDAQIIFMFSSPTEFKHRNIFVPRNFLSRC